MPRFILGLSAFYHDSAAALLSDGQLVAAAQEERFSRRKHDARFPGGALRWCLAAGGIGLTDLDAIVFYDKPFLKFERLLETSISFAPRGFRSFAAAMPVWLKDKLWLKQRLRRELAAIGGIAERALPPLLFSEHHRSHAASAFFFSPFERAAVLCLDGVGEWATTSVWRGNGSTLLPQWQIDFPHSLGLLYSAFTGFAGFTVNADEYKLMGLAPFGEPRFADLIRAELIDLKPDGTYRLNLTYFDYCTGLRMTSPAFDRLFGGPARAPGGEITQREKDLAASIQQVTEEVVLRLARTVHAETGEQNLCLAGGVALNCVANGRLQREGPFANLWIQPAAGDAGAAAGAAAVAWHEHFGQPRTISVGDGMAGALLGPAFSDADSAAALTRAGARFEQLDEAALLERVAARLADGHVIGWVQGPMEFGPRALGNRSILADPRSPTMQSRINRKIKFRESFRPFAPAVLAEQAAQYFALAVPSPYMLLVAPVRAAGDHGLLPAVTHVDGSARIQTVTADSNPRLHALLAAFAARSGCPVLVNTSFNLGGEPIVCTPAEAYDAFMRSELDDLVIGNLLVEKTAQPVPVRAAPLPADSGPLSAAIWLRVRDGLGRAGTWFVLGLAYAVAVLPTALVRRLGGRDAMRRRFEPDAVSYRLASRQSQRAELGKLW